MNTITLPALDEALTKISVSQQSAMALRSAFAPHFERVHALATEAGQIKADEPKLARSVRLSIKASRNASEATRKAQKEDSLRFGKAVDGIHAVLEFQAVPLERALLEIEEAEERAANAARLALQAERVGLLKDYMDTAGMDLSLLPEPAFMALWKGAIKTKEDRQIAEAIAQAAAAEARAMEQAAALAKEAEGKAERDRLMQENQRLAAEAVRARADREAAEVAARKAKAELDAKAAAERKRVEDLAKAEAAKQAAEAATIRLAGAAPDREKLRLLAAYVRGIPAPALSGTAGAVMSAQIAKQISSFANWIELQGECL